MVASEEPMVLCQNPESNEPGIEIARWKYDLMSRVILEVVSQNSEGIGIFDLPKLIDRRLTREERSGLGSVAWYAIIVKLDLEARGEIERVPQSRPERVRRR